MNLNIKQKEAINKLSKLKAGALFMKMGTGKTRVAIELAKLKQKDFDYVVWIAPASLIYANSYKDEIYKWINGLEREIKFFSVEGIGGSDIKYTNLYNLTEKYKTFCIIDESITIKNMEAKRTTRLLSMWNKFTFRLILNGTLLTQGLIDLYSQINFIHPGILKMSESEFANKFLTYRNEGEKPWKRWSRSVNEAALVEIIRPYIYDCSSDISINKINHDINCILTKEERKRYNTEKNNYLDKIAFENKHFDFLSIIQRLQHIYTVCCKNKLDLFFSTIYKIRGKGEKILVFCKYLDEIELLRKNLDCVVLTGKEGRNNAVKNFKGNTDILLATYGIGSFGLNLQFANNVLFFTQTFDYKHKEQGLHRIYRIGQTKDCHIYNMYVNTQLENIIKSSLDKKEGTLKNIERFIKQNGIENL